MSGQLEELERKAKDIRDFIIDVYEYPPIGPLLFAYENAIEELVREQRRGRFVQLLRRVTVLAVVSRVRRFLWVDERRLLRKLGPLARPFADLAIAVARDEISSKRAVEVFSEELTQLFKDNRDPAKPFFVFDIDLIERCLVGFADRIGERLRPRLVER